MSDRLTRVKSFMFGPSATDDPDDFSSDFALAVNEEETSTVEYTPMPKRAQEKPAPQATVTPIDQRRRTAPVQTAVLSEIVHAHPRSFAEAVGIGETFKEGIPVILNMTSTDENQALKLIDFCSGMAFVTGGTLEKITTRVFLLTPHSIKLTDADKTELASQHYLHS